MLAVAFVEQVDVAFIRVARALYSKDHAFHFVTECRELKSFAVKVSDRYVYSFQLPEANRQ